MHPRPQRISSADARSRVGGESDGRCHVRNDAEVEHEHVRRKDGNAHLHECRRSDGRGDDVVRRGRHAHAEHDCRDHGEEHRGQEHPPCHLDQPRGKAQPDTRLRDDTDNDARRCARDEHAEHRLCTTLEPVDDLDRLHARGFSQHGTGDGEDDRDKRRTHGRVARYEEIDNDDERDREVPAFLDEGQRIRQFVARDSFEVLALRLEMHAEPHTRKVEECGDRSRLDDLDVGNADELRHEECRCAHNRRHELPARGGRRLDRAREIRMVAELLHHRDRERTRADDVRDGAA